MKTRSAKAKGRRLQNWTRDKILESFPQLKLEDVKPAIMGESGVDIHFSPVAEKYVPFSIECKNRKNISVYAFLSQADSQEKGYPLVVAKADRKKPIAILDAELFFKILGMINGFDNKKNK